MKKGLKSPGFDIHRDRGRQMLQALLLVRQNSTTLERPQKSPARGIDESPGRQTRYASFSGRKRNGKRIMRTTRAWICIIRSKRSRIGSNRLGSSDIEEECMHNNWWGKLCKVCVGLVL